MPTDTTTTDAASNGAATNDNGADDAASKAAAATAATALGDAGKKALDEERAARAAAEKDAKAAKAELEKLKAASMSDTEKAIAEAKAEGRKELLAETSEKLIKAQMIAAAAGKFAHPGDAALFIDWRDHATDAGELNTKTFEAAMAEKLKTRPDLAPAGRPGALPGGGAKPSDGTSMDDFIRRSARG